MPVRGRVDTRRLARALVLSAWAGFLAWLWLSGHAYRYLGPRTLWVIPFGTAALAIAAALHVAGLRREPASGAVTRGEALGLFTLLLPIVVVVAVPGAELGASAASRRAPVGLAGALAVGSATAPVDPEDISFREIYFAGLSEEYATRVGVGHGMRLTLTGFVSHPSGTPEDVFHLTRFYVSCCAADAVPYSVPVPEERTGGDFPDDTWVEVSGRLFRDDSGYALYAEEIRRVAPPKNPYLY